MEEIGNYRYPGMPLAAAIDYARKLQTASKGGPMNMGAVAAVLGHTTANSGGFLSKVAELKAYGLLEGRGDQIRTTQLADHLTVPSSQDELARTAEQVVRKVPLFNELMDRLRGIPADDDAIAMQLAAMTGQSRAEIQAHLPRLGKVLREAIAKSQSLPVGSMAPPPNSPSGPSGSTPVGVAAQPPVTLGHDPAGDAIVFDLRIGARNEHKVGTLTSYGVKSVKRYLENLLKDTDFWKEVEEEAVDIASRDTPRPGPDGADQ